MRLSLAVLATFVAFAVTSNEALSGAQLSHKLKAEKSLKDALLDAPLSLSCTIGDHAEIDLCSWRQEDGPPLHVKGSHVIDSQNNTIEGISVNQTNPR